MEDCLFTISEDCLLENAFGLKLKPLTWEDGCVMDFRSRCLPAREQLAPESTHAVKLVRLNKGMASSVDFLVTSDEPELEELRLSMESLRESLTSFDGNHCLR